MALPNITLAEFNRIASGDYNAGQIDFATDRKGRVILTKINNFVHRTSKNKTTLDRQRILDIKETFIAALRLGGVTSDNIAKIRAQLGLPVELSAQEKAETISKAMENRFKPLSRDEVRKILDEYAKGGRGTQTGKGTEKSFYANQKAYATKTMSESHANKRDAINAANEKLTQDARNSFSASVTDVAAVLSGFKPLSEIKKQRDARFTGLNAINEQARADSGLKSDFEHLFGAAIKMLAGNVAESEACSMSGVTVKLVKDEDGNITALVGDGASPVKVNTGLDATKFAAVLASRAARDRGFLGAKTVQNVLDAAYNDDIDRGISASDRTSLTRVLSTFIIESQAPDTDANQLLKGNYNTVLLYEIASEAIEGKDVADTKAKLDAYHAELAKGNADLPPEMKEMLLAVADIPIEKSEERGRVGQYTVKPIVADIKQAVEQIQVPHGPAPFVPPKLGRDGVKNFVADLVFSDETMVGDVKDIPASERMREFLSDDKRLTALITIIKNPDVLETAVAPQIKGAVKEGFARIITALDEAFKAAHGGETLADAAKKPGFDDRFAAFFKDPQKLTGAVLSRFDQFVQSMANKGCEQIQTFINNVFQVDTANADNVGAVTNDPYKNMSPKEIKEMLDRKSLNEILDAASNSESPGQIGFFRQIISTYFTQLSRADKRSAFAAAMRYADVFDFGDKKDAALQSAQEAAINKFTGAILKGTSPLLQKMLQGLPKDIVGKYSDALEDMKCNLAPIPDKVVQAQLMKLINDSEGKIKSITVKNSLGAASVGEAFSCEFTYTTKETAYEDYEDPPGVRKKRPVLDNQGNEVKEDKEHVETFVVKIMRHDAVKRVREEAKIFTAAAEKIPGMGETWAGQLEQYMKEFDFTTEADNVNEGVKLYDIADDKDHPLYAIAKGVKSMKLANADIVKPKKDVLVCQMADGETADRFFKDTTKEIRKAAPVLFKQDPATGRVLWEEKKVDGEIKKMPVLKENIPAMSVVSLSLMIADNQDSMRKVSKAIMQATKAWFHEALLGSGKFHGDTHAGNLMVTTSGTATFIDFGNLYQLKKNRTDGVNEQHELLRVITGAAFRDKNFILNGFDKLMTDKGRIALMANREKAEAILDSVLDKNRGGFAFNIVYRLQAAVVELQKLGLELPPPINCFIQSMVRLSNTVTEMNTIINQSIAMVDTAKNLVRPAPQRDELDLLGRFFDVFASKDGKKIVKHNGQEVPQYIKTLDSKEFGGDDGWMRRDSKTFEPGTGIYTVKVRERIAGAADPLAEVEKLVTTLRMHADTEHNKFSEAAMTPFNGHYAELKKALADAKTPDAKKAAIQNFANAYSEAVANVLDSMATQLSEINTRTYKRPTTFAKGLTDVLLGNFDALKKMLTAEEQGALQKDTLALAFSEFGIWIPTPEKVLAAMREDAKKSAGEKDYKIDIGV